MTQIGSTTPAAGASTPSSTSTPSGTSSTTVSSYWPKTDLEYGVRWNNGDVEKIVNPGGAYPNKPKEAIRIFMNSLKLRRVGVSSKENFLVAISSRKVVKNGASSNEWKYEDWEDYQLTREDLIDLYKAG